MGREKVLITVKTYPTLSRKHGELVCTAGVREDGSWVRLYPIPFRLLDYKDRYQKFDWIETRLVRNTKDPRPETFHLADTADIQQVGRMETVDNWRERRDLMLKKAKVYDRLEPLIDAAHANQLSLAVFKPTKILDFVWESDEREWDQSKVDAMRSNADQAELFEGDTWRQTFKFSYRFEDAGGKQSEMQVLDWETGQLFWNCLRAADGDERLALAKVREKYMDQFLKTDLHFFLGTTKEFHSWATNPFLIIGVFPIPFEVERELFKSSDLLTTKGTRLLRVDLEEINAELVRYLARHPEKMHSLQPRKFEELVAELFRAQGYEVELTRISKDGGFDIRVVRKTAVGLGLTLIECKRYSQGNPVGVELVRGLHSWLKPPMRPMGSWLPLHISPKELGPYRKHTSTGLNWLISPGFRQCSNHTRGISCEPTRLSHVSE